MFGIIYRATNLINNKIYIGKTKQELSRRISNHYGHLKDQTYFHKALAKYNKEDWKWDIIDFADNEKELNEKECYWIKQYNSTNEKIGYNLTKGGDSAPLMTKEDYDRARQTRISNRFSDEELQFQHQKIISKRKRHRAVRCLDTNQIFVDPIQAAQFLISQNDKLDFYNTVNAIRKCARGETKTARGYHWEYLSEEEAKAFSPNSVCLLETGEIFRSITQAAQLKHQSAVNIRKCCTGEIENNAGYHWIWLNK